MDFNHTLHDVALLHLISVALLFGTNDSYKMLFYIAAPANHCSHTYRVEQDIGIHLNHGAAYFCEQKLRKFTIKL